MFVGDMGWESHESIKPSIHPFDDQSSSPRLLPPPLSPHRTYKTKKHKLTRQVKVVGQIVDVEESATTRLYKVIIINKQAATPHCTYICVYTMVLVCVGGYMYAGQT